jgi:hypothetical protein
MMLSRRIILFLMTFLTASVLLHAQSAPEPAAKPVSLEGLTAALRIGGLSTEELVDIVNRRGVAFQLTEQAESELRAAGAAAPLIEAVGKNYRSPVVPAPVAAPPPVQLPPLAEKEIITLLQVGTASQRIAQMVDQRGVNFSLSPSFLNELTGAGAESDLLAAINSASAKFQAQAAGSPSASAAPVAHVPESKPAVTSLKNVHALFIDKMNDNLDGFLRVEIAKQLTGRFQIVMDKEKADALLVGTGQQSKDVGSVLTGGYLGLHDTATGAVSIVNQAGIVLWSAEAGDRTFLFGPLTRGGTSEVASRLVQNLKKSLQTN